LQGCLIFQKAGKVSFGRTGKIKSPAALRSRRAVALYRCVIQASGLAGFLVNSRRIVATILQCQFRNLVGRGEAIVASRSQQPPTIVNTRFAHSSDRHTITFGPPPVDLVNPSPDVAVDLDRARHPIDSASDSTYSGFIIAVPQGMARPRSSAPWDNTPPRHFPERRSRPLHLRPARQIRRGWKGDCQPLREILPGV
jgi:hypothetical protein